MAARPRNAGARKGRDLRASLRTRFTPPRPPGHKLAGLGRVDRPLGQTPDVRDPREEREGGERREGEERERRERDRGKERGRERPDYQPELLCRTYAGDLGARPIADPNFVFWESPDIWVEGPGGDPDQAVAGTRNTVKVHVWNNGLADCWGATVDLYWCDPSVGVDMGNAHPIGSRTLPVYAGYDAVVAFDWTPTPANGGHECLVAQVYEPVADPLVAPFRPKLDRHVAQRNVSVIAAKAGQMMSLPFMVPNLSLADAESRLEVVALAGQAMTTLRSAMGLRAAPLLRGARAGIVELGAHRVARAGAAAPTVYFRPNLELRAGKLSDLRASLALSARAVAESANRRPSHDEPGERGLRTTHAVRVASSSIARFEFRAAVAPGAKRGAMQAYRVVERVNGEVTGGVTVVLKVT